MIYNDLHYSVWDLWKCWAPCYTVILKVQTIYNNDAYIASLSRNKPIIK